MKINVKHVICLALNVLTVEPNVAHAYRDSTGDKLISHVDCAYKDVIHAQVQLFVLNVTLTVIGQEPTLPHANGKRGTY